MRIALIIWLLACCATAQAQYLGPDYSALDHATLVTGPDVPMHADCASGELRDDFGWGSCTALATLIGSSGSVWVDASWGGTESGTESEPYNTIAEAITASAVGNWIVIRAGTYREDVRPDKRLTIIAYPGETATIDGTDDASAVAWEALGGGVWYTDWVWTTLPNGGDQTASKQRREVFVADGTMLNQQGSGATLAAGQFKLTGPPSAPDSVHLYMPDGSDPNDATIYVGQRRLLLLPSDVSNEACNSTSAVDSVRVVGLKFRYGTSERQQMSVCVSGDGWRLEEVDVSWQKAGGIKLRDTGHVLRGVIANDNGIEGIGSTGCTNCVIEYSEWSRNRWEPEADNGHGGGAKHTRCKVFLSRYNLIQENQDNAEWTDVFCHDYLILGNHYILNQNHSVKIENGDAGFAIPETSTRNIVINSLIYNTRPLQDDVDAGNGNNIAQAAAINFQNADSNYVVHTTLWDNNTSIRVDTDDRGPSSINEAYVYNTIAHRSMYQPGGNAWTMYFLGSATTYLGGGNLYWKHPNPSTNQQAFFFKANKFNDLATWLSYVTTDGGSAMIDTTLTVITTDHDADGWLLPAESQARNDAVALPDFSGRGNYWDINQIVTRDYYGNARPASGGDIGAHEYQASGSAVVWGSAPGSATIADTTTIASAGVRGIWKRSNTARAVAAGAVSGNTTYTIKITAVTGNTLWMSGCSAFGSGGATAPDEQVTLDRLSVGGMLRLSRRVAGLPSMPVAQVFGLDALPLWLRLTRTGDTFEGFYSTNGSSYTSIGTTAISGFATSATYGAAAYSRHATNETSCSFVTQ